MVVEAETLSPAEWLFRRKQNFVQTYDCTKLLRELTDNDDAITSWTAIAQETARELKAAQDADEECQMLVALEVEGKNETERKARRMEVLRTNERYQQIREKVAVLEGTLANTQAKIEALRRYGKRLELDIKFRIAALEAIG